MKIWKWIKRLLGIKTPLPGGIKKIWADPPSTPLSLPNCWDIKPPLVEEWTEWCNKEKDD